MYINLTKIKNKPAMQYQQTELKCELSTVSYSCRQTMVANSHFQMSLSTPAKVPKTSFIQVISLITVAKKKYNLFYDTFC